MNLIDAHTYRLSLPTYVPVSPYFFAALPILPADPARQARHPECGSYLMALSVMSAFGQLIIFFTIKR